MDKLLSSAIYTPYNTARALLLARNISPLDELGGNCVYQTGILQNKLEANGYNCLLVKANTLPVHYAALVNSDGDFYYLDPVLRQLEPINVSRIIREKTEYTFKSAPQQSSNPDKIKCIPTSSTGFTIEFYSYRANGYALVFHWEYDLEASKVDTLPNEWERVVSMSSGGRMCITALLGDDALGIISLQKDETFTSIHLQGSEFAKTTSLDPNFNEQVRKLSDFLRVSVDSILETLLTGSKIFKEEKKRKKDENFLGSCRNISGTSNIAV